MGTLTRETGTYPSSTLDHAPECESVPVMRVNGAPASGWIDLDDVEPSGEAGYLCVHRGHTCTPVRGQVLSVEGPIRVAGNFKRRRCEFRVTDTWECENGTCVHVAHFPILVAVPSWEELHEIH